MFQAQGDILIIPMTREVEHGEQIKRRDGRLILAEGEATGHHHSIVDKYATAYRFRPDDMPSPMSIGLLVIDGDGVRLEHQEHDALDLAPGRYEVRRQREATLEQGFRFVAD